MVVQGCFWSLCYLKIRVFVFCIAFLKCHSITDTCPILIFQRLILEQNTLIFLNGLEFGIALIYTVFSENCHQLRRTRYCSPYYVIMVQTCTVFSLNQHDLFRKKKCQSSKGIIVKLWEWPRLNNLQYCSWPWSHKNSFIVQCTTGLELKPINSTYSINSNPIPDRTFQYFRVVQRFVDFIKLPHGRQFDEVMKLRKMRSGST